MSAAANENRLVFPLDGTEDDALFDSGTDTESVEDSVLGEPYRDLGTILCTASALMKSFWYSSEHTASHCIKYVKLLCSFKRLN